MKKKVMICTMLLCTLFLTGCLKKTKISVSSFEEILKEEGYTIETYDKDFMTKDKKNLASAISKDGYSINYIEYYDDDAAKDFFNETYDKYENSCNIKTETNGTNYNTFKCDTGEEYIAITRVENTVVYALTTKNNKDDVKETLKKLKY